MTIQVIISAALCGILAAVYHAILIAPGHILSKPRQLIERLVYWSAQKSQYGRLYRVTEWFFHSLYDCSWCLAGQIALFGYIYHGGRDPFDACLCIGLSITVCFTAFKYLTNGKEA